MKSLFDKQEVLALIEERIAPLIGKNMARASTQAHCEKLGIHQQQMSADDVSALIHRIGQAMVVFVGKAQTERILDDIHRALGTEGCAS